MSEATDPVTMNDRVFRYQVDGLNRIVSVDDAWLDFAHENQAPHLNEDSVIDRSLFDFVFDLDTVHIYRLLLERLRFSGEAITVPFRCDSPTCRRFMSLTMSLAQDGHVLFESRILREEPRDYVALLDPSVGRSKARFVKVCGWCKKVRIREERWVEVEAAVEHVEFFTRDECTRVTHGMCPPCFETVKRQLTN